MATFHYPFQRILDLKENEKDFAQIQMAEAIKKQEESLRKNQEIYQKIIEVENEKNQKQLDGVNIFELRMLENYIDQLKNQLLSAERDLERLDTHVVQTQSHLCVKVQEEKTWLNLKNQRRKQFDQEMKQSEQALFDEMAANRFYRALSTERG
ncbi:flagellar export protein FliJ [Mesobacillus maritimus]|uniref:flagellar export protein FliJ n=1 Tax=Mesobacillus maritimus TaxID=1643336 RepID=UPI00384BE289